MKESLQHRLESLLERHEELAANLSEPSVIANQEKFRNFDLAHMLL